MSSNLETIFRKDTRQFLDKLEPLLARFETGQAQREDLDEAFRLFHSIKSEAAHLEHSRIAEHAHRAESVLHELREDFGNESYLNQLFTAAAGIAETITQELGEESFGTPQETEAEQQDEIIPSPGGETPFGEFELILLAESRDRGESLYRMICDFDPETEMKYIKAVLILNNLEQQVNVIRTTPDLGSPMDEELSRVGFYFTTDRPEADLFASVNIDQVRRVFLSRLAWEQHLPAERSPSVTPRIDSREAVSLPAEQLNLVWNRALQARLAHTEEDDAFKALDDALQQTRFIPFGTVFADLQAIVQQSAEEQGKEARCDIQGREVPLERWLARSLRPSLVQILRNAVSHGIEEKSERLRLNKSPRGEIKLSYAREAEELLIRISDDGKGIDEAGVRARAAEAGLDAAAPLLHILATPGFSTSEDASLHAGRGVGLDIVSQGLAAIAGADLRLEPRKEGGTLFTVTIPMAGSSRLIQFARHKSRLIALDQRALIEKELPKSGFFSRETDSRVYYRGLPVYTCDGYLFWIDGYPENEELLLIDDQGFRFYLLVDEILFTEELSPEMLELRQQEMSPFSRMLIGGFPVQADYLRFDALVGTTKRA